MALTDDDVREAVHAGADALLLILRDLDDDTVARLMAGAAAAELDAFVEAHDAAELARAVALGADPIGINARDLATFEIDRRRQLELVAAAPRDRVVVAESGIWSRAQGAEAELAGADAILVGSSLMKAPDPALKLASLLARPLVKICGLTREEDVAAVIEDGDKSALVIFNSSQSGYRAYPLYARLPAGPWRLDVVPPGRHRILGAKGAIDLASPAIELVFPGRSSAMYVWEGNRYQVYGTESQ